CAAVLEQPARLLSAAAYAVAGPAAAAQAVLARARADLLGARSAGAREARAGVRARARRRSRHPRAARRAGPASVHPELHSVALSFAVAFLSDVAAVARRARAAGERSRRAADGARVRRRSRAAGELLARAACRNARVAVGVPVARRPPRTS